MAKQLVRLWERPSYDGKRFRYYLLYTDEQGRRRQKSLGQMSREKEGRNLWAMQIAARPNVKGHSLSVS
jgi:hypothetical protein